MDAIMANGWTKFLKVTGILVALIYPLVISLGAMVFSMRDDVLTIKANRFTRDDGARLLEQVTLLDRKTSETTGKIFIQLEAIKQLIPRDTVPNALIGSLSKIELRLEQVEKRLSDMERK